jgi:choline monooxygenase
MHELEISTPGSVAPHTLYDGCLDEPGLLARDQDDALHCLSNVCTHRGMRLIEHAGHERCLTCRYHGRRFELDGRFRSMPEFEDAEGFPRDDDNLRTVPMFNWRGLLFCSLSPSTEFNDVIAPIEERAGFLPVDRARFAPERARDYLVRANWALYIDNYLEGFHIPYVHDALADAIDYGEYDTHCFEYANLQLGVARGAEDTFDLPPGHPDTGKNVAAWYFWLFPTTMLNVYPWGISVNVVEPMGVDRTRVRFLPYVWDESLLDRGVSSDLDRVEREDESIVEAVQASISSRNYSTGRYSPTREQCVHHFHSLLAAYLSK